MTTQQTIQQTTEQATEQAIDEDALMAFVFRSVEEVGATLNAALVVLGDKLGYYRELAAGGALTPAELAERTGTALPYAREWLNAQAAGSFVHYDPDSGRYALPAEHAVALTDEDSPAFLPGLFQIALGTVAGTDRVLQAARDHEGIGWHERNEDVHVGCERFFRPSYLAYLVDAWLPAAGASDLLRAGGRAADIGCGHGASTVLMAQGFPEATFVGSDYHAASVEVARERAEAAGVADRVTFEVTPAQDRHDGSFDVVTTFDALHDMGDPVGTAREVFTMLADDGVWMIVEPMAGDHVEDNLNPVGRTYYGFSTLLCTPASLSQEVGLAIGTQAGPAKIREIATAAGFGQCATVAQTPFHRVLAVRK